MSLGVAGSEAKRMALVQLPRAFPSVRPGHPTDEGTVLVRWLAQRRTVLEVRAYSNGSDRMDASVTLGGDGLVSSSPVGGSVFGLGSPGGGSGSAGTSPGTDPSSLDDWGS